MEARDGYWVSTYSGKRVYLLAPSQDDFLIGDIAHGLSNISRYNGQCISFYSVAEHCYRGALRALHDYNSPTLAREMLIHDGAEAYVGDMVRPLTMVMPDYRGLRDAMQAIINLKFTDNSQLSSVCNLIDNRMLATEAPVMFKHNDEWWTAPGFEQPFQNEWENTRGRPKVGSDKDDGKRADIRDMEFMTPRHARRMFLDLWHDVKDAA